MKRVKIQDIHKLLDLAYEATLKTGCRASISFLDEYKVYVIGHRTKAEGEKLDLCETFAIDPHKPEKWYGPAYKKCCDYFENLIKEASNEVIRN